MFSKEERKAIHGAYWKKFKSHISRHKSLSGRRVNWINYPTGLKQIYVRLHADNKGARFSIDIQAKDEEIRLLIWEQFFELKKVLHDSMPSEGVWEKRAMNDAGDPIHRIRWTIQDVNMYHPEDESRIFEFFKNHLLGFDLFYTTYKDVLFGLLN